MRHLKAVPFLVVFLALALGACAALPADQQAKVSGTVQKVEKFTTADLENGIAIFEAHGIVYGSQCYQSLLKNKTALDELLNTAQVSGAFSAFAAAYVLNHGAKDVAKEDITNNCAVLYTHYKTDTAGIPGLISGLGLGPLPLPLP